MLTVGYEQARGMRAVNQKVDGYSFNVSRTLPVSAAAIFDAWTQPKLVKQWMDGERSKSPRPRERNRSD